MTKKVTNVFLVRDDEVCLGMKKRGFGVGFWNGTGGKIMEGETSIEAAKREAKEEFGVDLKELIDRGNIIFVFKDGLKIDCDIYLCRNWIGEVSESEEMAPKWFKINDLPLESMWSDDKFWLHKVLENKKIKATFYFSDDAKTIEKFDVREIN